MAITATGIKNIWYADPAKVTGDLTGTMLGSILKDPTTKKVPNVHQDAIQKSTDRRRISPVERDGRSHHELRHRTVRLRDEGRIHGRNRDGDDVETGPRRYGHREVHDRTHGRRSILRIPESLDRGAECRNGRSRRYQRRRHGAGAGQ